MSDLTRYQAHKIGEMVHEYYEPKGILPFCELTDEIQHILDNNQSIPVPPLEPFVWYENTPENCVRIPKFLWILVKFGRKWSGDSDFQDGPYWHCNNDAPYTHFMLINKPEEK